MHSTAIIFNVVLVSLVSYVHGDLIMQSQTYDFNATAPDNKGKLTPISGTILNVQIVFLEMENGTGASDDVKFSIWANAPGSQSDMLVLSSSQQDSSDYSESVPTALFDSLLSAGQKNGGPPLVGIPSQIFQVPQAPSQNSQSVPQSTSNNKQSSTQSTNVHNTNFSSEALLAPLNNIVPKGAPFSGSTGQHNASSTSASLLGPVNNVPTPSRPMNNANSNFSPPPSPPKNAPLQPLPINNNANSNFVSHPGPLNNAPTQPSPINNNHNANSNVESLLGPSHNASTSGNSNAQGVVGNKNMRTKRSVDGHTNHSMTTNGTTRTYTVQNVTLWPSNSVATIKLYPVAGYPWIKNASGLGNDRNAQTWLNPHNLNLSAPILNVSVSTSPGSSIDDENGALSVENTDSNSKPSRSYYNTLQDLQIAAMKNGTDRLSSIIQGYLNNSAAQTDLLSSLENIVDNDLEQLVDGLDGGMGNTMTSTPTMADVIVVGTDIPKNISNTWYNVTSNPPSQQTNGTGGGSNTTTNQPSQPTNGTGRGNTTTESSTTGSPMTGSPTTGSPTTESPKAAGSGNVVISSWMTIFASSLIALLSTIMVV